MSEIISERTTSRESPSHRDFAALQVRLLKGGKYLFPSNSNLTKVTDEIGKDEEVATTVDLMSYASTQERLLYWQDNKDNHIKSWLKQTTDFFHDDKQKKHIDILSHLKLGDGEDAISLTTDFTSADAQKLYDRYFSGINQRNKSFQTTSGETKMVSSNIALFVQDVLNSYTQNGVIDINHLTTDFASIQMISSMFGEQSSQLIKELILAKAKMQVPEEKNKLITQANEEITIDDIKITRLNSLSLYEERLLAWLTNVNTEKLITPILPKPVPPAANAPPLIVAASDTETSQEIVQHLPENNLHAANHFCQVLRNIVKTKGVLNTRQGRDEYNYKQDNLELTVIKGIDWFTSDIINVARKYHVPMILTGPIHANIVLKGPHKNQDGEWGISYYDPLKKRDHWSPLKKQESFEEYIQRKLVEGTIKSEPSIIHISESPNTFDYIDSKGDIQNMDNLYMMYFNENTQNPVEQYVTSAPWRSLREGTYDLSLEGDTELNQELIDGKIQAFQQNDQDCLPLSLFAGILRYAAKPGNKAWKNSELKQFNKDFGLTIFTREEILAAQAKLKP